MRRTISAPLAIGMILAVLLIGGFIGWRLVSPPPAGPSAEEVSKHTGTESIREAMAKGPPPGPPLPGGDRSKPGSGR